MCTGRMSELFVKARRQSYLSETNTSWLNNEVSLSYNGSYTFNAIDYILASGDEALSRYRHLIEFCEANDFKDEIYVEALYQRINFIQNYRMFLLAHMQTLQLLISRKYYTPSVTVVIARDLEAVKKATPSLNCLAEFLKIAETYSHAQSYHKAGELYYIDAGPHFIRSQSNPLKREALNNARKCFAKANLSISHQMLDDIEADIHRSCHKLTQEGDKQSNAGVRLQEANDLRAAKLAYIEALRCYEVSIQNYNSVYARTEKANTLLKLAEITLDRSEKDQLLNSAETILLEVLTASTPKSEYKTHATLGLIYNLKGLRAPATYHLDRALSLTMTHSTYITYVWILRAEFARDESIDVKRRLLSHAAKYKAYLQTSSKALTLLAAFNEKAGLLEEALHYYQLLKNEPKIERLTQKVAQLKVDAEILRLPQLHQTFMRGTILEKITQLRHLQDSEQTLLDGFINLVGRRSGSNPSRTLVLESILNNLFDNNKTSDTSLQSLTQARQNLEAYQSNTNPSARLLSIVEAIKNSYIANAEALLKYLTTLSTYLIHINTTIKSRTWIEAKTILHVQFKRTHNSERLKQLLADTTLSFGLAPSKIRLVHAAEILRAALSVQEHLMGSELPNNDRDPNADLLFQRITQAFSHLASPHNLPPLDQLNLGIEFPVLPKETNDTTVTKDGSYSNLWFWSRPARAAGPVFAAATSAEPLRAASDVAPVRVSPDVALVSDAAAAAAPPPPANDANRVLVLVPSEAAASAYRPGMQYASASASAAVAYLPEAPRPAGPYREKGGF